ncbi:MAG: hypothetical protein LBH34_01410, partial [Prevotellaceae bacterium]|nr:hypothetical protein [Prevotellaceae bacterium]
MRFPINEIRMRQVILIIILFGSIFSYGQVQVDLYSRLKDSVPTSWIKENPSFSESGKSFFSEKKAVEYIVVPVQMNDEYMFLWDDNFSVLEFLLKKDKDIELQEGMDADSVYGGTKIVWKKEQEGQVWLGDSIYSTLIDSWHLMQWDDCPGTIPFPVVTLEKPNISDEGDLDDFTGLMILSSKKEINSVESFDMEMVSGTGQSCNGIGFDFNNDEVADVFLYDEMGKNGDTYTRLYMNVDGKWICKWISLDEQC